MGKNIVIGTIAAVTAAGAALVVLPAVGDDGGSGNSARTAAGSGAQGHAGHGGGAAGESRIGALGGTNKSGAVFFAGSLNGANEVPAPGGPAVGDKDGAALALMRVQGDEVSFAFKFRGIDTPTLAHIHQGVKGVNGAIKIPLITEKLKDGSDRVTGTVKVKDAALLQQLKDNPGGFYFNLHTGEFPGGAVRGQVHKLDSALDLRHPFRSFQASVRQGQQIYKCTRQQDGSYAFTQHNVRARLDGNIAHFFVKPQAGPPAWLAPDLSAVTGKLTQRIDNGPKNIPELHLAATQVGRGSGKLSATNEILRLNTVGGVAPAGSCKPGAKAAVDYRADYVFVGR
ncbi:CHRD domain-containing protein [Streptomyces boninensis]|uniref:CHRD domain-containing protein n=1 Tax=Streptomyces boninensis TaxID=2039455 RepID=UPI003B2210B1